MNFIAVAGIFVGLYFGWSIGRIAKLEEKLQTAKSERDSALKDNNLLLVALQERTPKAERKFPGQN